MAILTRDAICKIAENLNYIDILKLLSTCQKHWRLYQSPTFWQYLLSKHELSMVETEIRRPDVTSRYVDQAHPRLKYRQSSMKSIIGKICNQHYRYGFDWVKANIYGNVMLLGTRSITSWESSSVIKLLKLNDNPYPHVSEEHLKVYNHDRLVILDEDQLYQFDCRTANFNHTYCKVEGVNPKNAMVFCQLFESAEVLPNNILYNRNDLWEITLDLVKSHLIMFGVYTGL